MKRALSGLCIAILLAACAPKPAQGPNPTTPLNQDRLNADIDREIGGLGTCVIVVDTASGRSLYQYGHFDVCDAARPPPCETFQLPESLIGLDAGVITPTTVLKWDGTPQPVSAWRVDADPTKAFQGSIPWWFGRLAEQIGAGPMAAALQRLGYGDAKVAGPLGAFWQGPAKGGGLTISPRQQVDFLRRFYAGRLPVKPAAAAFVQGLMVHDAGRDAKGRPIEIDGLAGSCSTQADGSNGVGWWVGRLKTPDRDVVFTASVTASAPPPGADIAQAMKDAFTDAGMWPGS